MMNISVNIPECIKGEAVEDVAEGRSILDRKDLIRLKNRLIVSCQAYEDNPLYGVENIVTLSKCAIKGNAAALRLCWPDAIAAVRKITHIPIVGINKIIGRKPFDMYRQVFITPTYESAVSIIEAGCDIAAMDGTLRGRGAKELGEIVRRIKREYPHIFLMADIATMEEAKVCEQLGFDILSSTLSGYTEETRERNNGVPDYEFIRQLKQETSCLVNAEGRIWNKGQLEAVRELEPDMITIGTAITNPMKITEYFTDALSSFVEEASGD